MNLSLPSKKGKKKREKKEVGLLGGSPALGGMPLKGYWDPAPCHFFLLLSCPEVSSFFLDTFLP
jgi:hypothetical protein